MFWVIAASRAQGQQYAAVSATPEPHLPYTQIAPQHGLSGTQLSSGKYKSLRPCHAVNCESSRIQLLLLRVGCCKSIASGLCINTVVRCGVCLQADIILMCANAKVYNHPNTKPHKEADVIFKYSVKYVSATRATARRGLRRRSLSCKQPHRVCYCIQLLIVLYVCGMQPGW